MYLHTIRTYTRTYLLQVNTLSQLVHGKKVLPTFTPPAAYTGEFFGVEYLYSETGFHFNPEDEHIDTQIDEGFCDVEERITPSFRGF